MRARLLAAAIVLMPAIAIVIIAATGGMDNWPHLLSNVIPRATLRTLILLAGVGTITAIVGVVSGKQVLAMMERQEDGIYRCLRGLW